MPGIDLTALSFDELINREWLITNSAGGYASSTLIGLNTRKYHGLLVAAMASPVRRMVILSRVEETVIVNGRSSALATVEYPGVVHPAGHLFLRAFTSVPFPHWAIQGDGWTIEKCVRLAPSGANDLLVTYTVLAADAPVELRVRPLLALRGIHDLMYQWSGRLEAEASIEMPGRVRIAATARTPEVHLAHNGAFDSKPCWYLSTLYRRERERGYSALEDLWTPGEFAFNLKPGQAANFAVSVEPIGLETVLAACSQADARQQNDRPVTSAASNDHAIGLRLGEIVDQFISMTPPVEGRPWSCIVPQYPWTAWAVRDMLIALPGALLIPGRHELARNLLLGLAALVRDGITPSEIDEAGGEPAYNACDTSLWLINASWQYLVHSNDDEMARLLFPVVREIIERYQAGCAMGISVNTDGMLRIRAAGFGSTWMNSKVNEWVITPRNGCPVELNALWYNALCIARELAFRLDDAPLGRQYATAAEQHRADFNQRFWNPLANCCYDVVNDAGEDASIRPNQLLAASLPFAVLAEVRVPEMLDTVRFKLLTPLGLRTLEAGDPNFQGRYAGDVVARDRAYHQGCVFPWLIGPYCTAMAKTQGPWPAAAEAIRRIVTGLVERVLASRLGVVPELFDGDAPHKPGGAISDVRAAAELNRVWHEHVLGRPGARGAAQSKVAHTR